MIHLLGGQEGGQQHLRPGRQSQGHGAAGAASAWGLRGLCVQRGNGRGADRSRRAHPASSLPLLGPACHHERCVHPALQRRGCTRAERLGGGGVAGGHAPLAASRGSALAPRGGWRRSRRQPLSASRSPGAREGHGVAQVRVKPGARPATTASAPVVGRGGAAPAWPASLEQRHVQVAHRAGEASRRGRSTTPLTVSSSSVASGQGGSAR